MPLSSEEAEGNPLSFMARQEAGGLSTTATQSVDSDLVLESGAFFPPTAERLSNHSIFPKYRPKSQVWWHTPVIPVFWR